MAKVKCSNCNGNGSFKCTSCRGSGTRVEKDLSVISIFGYAYDRTVKCSTCGGTGWCKCVFCNGSGYVTTKNSYK